jgi:RNase adapter protein RapZ
MKQPIFLIVTGLSGSGKSSAMKEIEDEGFFCMDNVPVDMLSKLVEIYDFASLNLSRVCFGVDIRGGADVFGQMAQQAILAMKQTMPVTKLIFIESKTGSMLNRFKETRRRHPMSDNYPNLLDAIEAEREIMTPIKDMADFVIDSTNLNVHEFAGRIKEIIKRVTASKGMYVEVRSFGFKKGIPLDADIVLDVRYLPNPHFVESLMKKTGLDPEVKEWLNSHKVYLNFIKKLKGFISFILPLCKKEGRSYLNIAIGCTGGRHRSVAIAEEVGQLVEKAKFNCKVVHRELSQGGL